jgi:hypothetical protein
LQRSPFGALLQAFSIAWEFTGSFNYLSYVYFVIAT